MKKIALYLALSSLVLAGCSKSKKPAAAMAAMVLKPKVVVETVHPGVIAEKLTFYGYINPWKKADLSPGMPGKVVKILVKEGDLVKEGRILAEMDNTQLSALENQYNQAKTNYDRMKELLQTNAISQSQFEQSEMAYKQAEIQIKNVRSNTQLAAPFSGVITYLARQAGEMYSPGMSLPGAPAGLIQIMDLNQMRLDVQVSEISIAQVKKGQKVEAAFDALPDSIFSGYVDWVNPAADYGSRTFTVRVSLPNPGRQLKPGYYAKASILIAEKPHALSVARAAVVNDRFIYIVKNDSLVEERQPKFGLGNEDRVEVLSGLADGETVIIAGNRGLGNNTVVEIVPPENP